MLCRLNHHYRTRRSYESNASLHLRRPVGPGSTLPASDSSVRTTRAISQMDARVWISEGGQRGAGTGPNRCSIRTRARIAIAYRFHTPVKNKTAAEAAITEASTSVG